ncbi:MAG: EAL domain-containing protein [Cyanobacteria bacterium P01_A01_bin.105]
MNTLAVNRVVPLHPETPSLTAQASPYPASAAHPLNTKTLKQIFWLSPIGMTILDLNGRFLSANQAFCDALGTPEPALLSRSFQEFTDDEDVPLLCALGSQLIRGKQRQHFQVETRHCSEAKAPLQVSLTVTIVRDDRQRPVCFLVQVVDLTERKWMEDQLKHHAFYDLLTGLANRALFINRLEQMLKRMERHSDERCAVLFLDLDRFKGINESLGHSIGDQLLVTLARRLEACVRRCDTLARLGGDEFAILLEETTGVEAVTTVCDRIHAALRRPFLVGDCETYTTISIGVVYGDGGQTASTLLSNADTALYRAKAQGGACHTVFEETMHQRAVTLWQLANHAQQAVQRQEMHVRYQPIVDLATGRTASMEALIRWHHPQHGAISPTEFIPVMEETGVITDIGYWVLKESCRQVSQWQQHLPPGLRPTINVNVSPRQLIHFALIEQIEQILDETGVAAEQLRLEITENTLIQTIDLSMQVLKALQRLNIGLCIDDFGMGYSSLSRLQQLPVDTIKIDRSFIRHIKPDGENAEITRSIINLARSLDMTVVAEGVETASQLAQLKALACDKVQGFYFAKPMLPDAALRFMQTPVVV